MGNPFLVSKMKKNDILLLFYSLKSGSSCQYIGTEQLRDMSLQSYCHLNAVAPMDGGTTESTCNYALLTSWM